MKRTELQKCCICGLGVMHANHVTFLRITVETFVLDPGAVQRRAGMEMYLGSPVLAQVLGPDEDLAKQIRDAQPVLVCQECSMKPLPPMELANLEPIPS